jgi:hypothetical protein
MNNDTSVHQPLRGERIKTTVPDTLDLADRAALAIRGMANSIDTELMTMYGQIFFQTPRPHLAHWASAETLCDPKFAESFPLLRLMSGSDAFAELEAKFREALRSRIDDGLYWDRYTPKRPWRNSYSSAHYGKGKDEDFSTLPGAGRMLRALLVWRELGDDSVEAEIRSLVQGLRRIAVCHEDYAYYPEKGGWGEPCSYPRSGWLNTDEARGETEGGEGAVTCMQSHQMYGAAKWYSESGDPVALDLAARLSRYCMLPRFWGGVPDPEGQRSGNLPGFVCPSKSDPAFTAGAELGHWYSHWHARAITLRGLLEYGIAAGDLRALEFVRRSYEFTLSQGIPRMGFINCFPGTSNHMESCALGDIIGLGVRLSDCGMGDYWDDVDACARNQLVEQQFTSADKLRRVAEPFKDVEWDGLSQWKQPVHPGEQCFDNVFERAVGVFGGTAMPNGYPNPWVMHCCTGNATQGLYYAWEGIVREQGDRATVNLFLNRAAKLVSVESWLPYAGKVVIRNRAARRLSVRIPHWVQVSQLRATVNGRDAVLDRCGRYLQFDGLSAGDAVELSFPVAETTARYTVNANSRDEMQYTCTFRASTLVDISPRDTQPAAYPFYERDHLRSDQAPMAEKSMFAAERVVRKW